MLSAQQQATLRGTNCEVAFDALTRQLYATDASHYHIDPLAVAFPRGVRQVSAIVDAAIQNGMTITPRGAGTGLAGGALGEGLVIDLARYNRQITDLDLERGSVRVGAGVVLDQLNQYLRPHGYCFGPDVATSSRATLGGMIANNSSGSYTPVYGTTAQHVRELEVVLADGRALLIGPNHDTLRKQRELAADLAYFHGLEIADRLPGDLIKRDPGYALRRMAAEPENPVHLLCGSEGTLAAIVSAELKILPLPTERGLAIIFFDSIPEAMQVTVSLLELQPAAIEHIDRILLDQTRGKIEFQAARDLLELDRKPCESMLVVEFFADVADRLAEVKNRRLGSRTTVLASAAAAGRVWALRKAGLSLLTSRKGAAKPVTCIEDAAVRPKDLPAYYEALQRMFQRLRLEASFYGHAASGLLHVRPVLDLRTPEDRKKFRQVACEVSALVRQFKGSLAAEHGVGIARTEFLREQVGDHLLRVMKEIKYSFDPNNLFNPGKIISDRRYRIDANLRYRSGYTLDLPFEPRLAFTARDGSFTANLDQCNGCGGCLKNTPTMCPTFMVTGEEVMSTRGRANAIRAALEGEFDPGASALRGPELERALSNCLSCKACATECPSNVNLPLLKAELCSARIERHGPSLLERVISSIDLLGRLGCLAPRLANSVLDSLVVRSLLAKTLGIGWQRPLPRYARTRFDHWFRRHARATPVTRGRVVLWDDTFVRYHEPHIGIAAVKVLEAAGFEVALPMGRKCCGRPAFSQGYLRKAAGLGQHNLALLNRDADNAPIVFLEPSCYSMFAQDYAELKLDGAARVAQRCHLFEQFIDDLLVREPSALHFAVRPGRIVIHAHCHVKSSMATGFLSRLAERLPERDVTLLDSGCCGMAGAFGALDSKYELSLKVAEPLMQAVRKQPFGTAIVASGASCRHQIEHLAPLRPRHMAEVLADALP
jgi:FAD/FMN-containing dehydrogenase/Fe-S oxidoreductase